MTTEHTDRLGSSNLNYVCFLSNLLKASVDVLSSTRQELVNV